MIKIRSVRVLDEKFNILLVKYPDDMRFSEENLIEQFRLNESDKWSRTFDQPVKIDIDYVTIPKQVNILSICKLTADEMKVTIDGLFGKTKQRELVLARMFAVNIMIDAGIPITHIEEHTPFKNRIYYYYQTQLANMRETDDDMDRKYLDVQDKVMTKIHES